MAETIILIGPSKTGKTTLMKLLGEALNRPYLDLDKLRWDYYVEIGYDREKGEAIRREGGMQALAAHWKPYDIYAVERVLSDYPTDHVLAFGAGHSVYEDAAQFERAKTGLSPFPHVILLLPSPDVDEAVSQLKARLRADEPEMPDDFIDTIGEINRYFIEHPSNAQLATLTVYTGGKSPAETCHEIMAHIQDSQ